MGEIKSTMDIIMEKTRDLTMTEEERRKFRKEELAGKIRGCIQKFLDGNLDLERFRTEIAAAGGKDLETSRQIVAAEVQKNIEPGKDNAPLLLILEKAAGVDGEPARRLLKEFEEKLNKEKAARGKSLLALLARKGFSGSAVVPNLNADKEWIHSLVEAKQLFRKQLEAQMGNQG